MTDLAAIRARHADRCRPYLDRGHDLPGYLADTEALITMVIEHHLKPGDVIGHKSVWSGRRYRDGQCACWWCQPTAYPPFPPGTGLCARCGAWMVARQVQWQDSLDVCNPCDEELETADD